MTHLGHSLPECMFGHLIWVINRTIRGSVRLFPASNGEALRHEYSRIQKGWACVNNRYFTGLNRLIADDFRYDCLASR